MNPNYDAINDVISGFAKVVVERYGFHHWIAQRISWGEVVSISLYRLYFPSYDVINDVIMSDADCTPSREPRSIAASYIQLSFYRNLLSFLSSAQRDMLGYMLSAYVILTS